MNISEEYVYGNRKGCNEDDFQKWSFSIKNCLLFIVIYDLAHDVDTTFRLL